MSNVFIDSYTLHILLYFMSVEWNVKWCPVSRTPPPLGPQKKGSGGSPEKLKILPTNSAPLEKEKIFSLRGKTL